MYPRSLGMQIEFPGAQAARLLPGMLGGMVVSAGSPFTEASKTAEAGI